MSEDMKKTAPSLKSRKLRYGAYSTVMTVFVLAILIIINLVLEGVDLKYDLSSDTLYTISDKSREALQYLSEDVTIYTLFKTGEEIFIYDEMVNDYQSASPRISIVNKDPYLNPQFVESFAAEGQEIPVNSIIVEGPEKSRVLSASDFITTGINYSTFQSYVESIDLEPLLTNAILYVTADAAQKIYFVTGHNEQSLSGDYERLLYQSNYEIAELNLYETDTIPDDADILFITTPERDWTDFEAEKVLHYLENGGKAIFFIDYTNVDYINIRKVFNAYGADYRDALVLESDMAHLIAMQGGYYIPYFIIPGMAEHEILTPIADKNYAIFMPYARVLKPMDILQSTVQIEPLLVSSDSSYIKTKESPGATANREEGDESGPFDLAYAVTDTFGDEPTKLVFVGTTTLLEDDYNNGTNATFVLNCLNWLSGSNDSVYIPGKTISNSTIRFNSIQEQVVLLAVSFIAIPGIIIITGGAVWFRRRNK